MADMSGDVPQASIDACFPAKRDRFADGTFEIGFALSGTVSAGAYTAGVLDYICEALDAWTLAKELNDPKAPRHEVIISTLSGASGGGINALLTAKSAGLTFPHGAVAGNPFFDTWAGEKAITFNDLLAVDPSTTANLTSLPDGLDSLLNTNAIADLATKVCQSPTAPALERDTNNQLPATRSYFADPFRVIVTATNVAGRLYDVKLAGETDDVGFQYRRHDDEWRFAVHGTGGPRRDSEQPRINELALTTSPVMPDNWDLAAAAALSTSAFPIALGARNIAGDRLPKQLRAVLLEGDDPTKARTAQLLTESAPLPDPSASGPTDRIIFVDGGVTDNDPLGLARDEVSGFDYHSPRDGEPAFRAIIAISPFIERARQQSFPNSLLNFGLALGGALVDQSRLSTADMALAVNPDIYSRFLIAPRLYTAGAADGSAALESGGADGFAGFLSRDRLEHDFLLGRYNGYRFLKDTFCFPESNLAIKNGGWTADQIADQTVTDSSGKIAMSKAGDPLVRMIPLMPALLKNPPKLPEAKPPTKALADYKDQIGKRADLLFDRYYDAIAGTSVLKGALKLVSGLVLKPMFRDAVYSVCQTFIGESPGGQTSTTPKK